MKQVFLFILLLSIAFFSEATPITALSSGSWGNTAKWNKNRLPQAGDTILIPYTINITISEDYNTNGNVVLLVYGTLTFANNNSTLRIGSNSTVKIFIGGKLKGNSASQKLRLGNNSIFDGNDDDVVGPQMADASTNGFRSFLEGALPVEFIGFTLSRKNSDVLVQWSTSEEVNASIYELERSFDGRNWSVIAYIAAIGNSHEVNHYSYTDKNIQASAVHYRIRQVDVDGQFTYTTVRSLRNDSSSQPPIHIASVQKRVLLQFPEQVKGSVMVQFVNLAGQVVDQQVLSNPTGQVVLNSKVSGHHIISLSNGQDLKVARQVIL